MLRRTIAVALLCLVLLLCGLDTSAVGAPAESDTALHALIHSQHAGAHGDVDELAAATFVALICLVAVTSTSGGGGALRRVDHAVAASPAIGWLTAHAQRGPPARA